MVAVVAAGSPVTLWPGLNLMSSLFMYSHLSEITTHRYGAGRRTGGAG